MKFKSNPPLRSWPIFFLVFVDAFAVGVAAGIFFYRTTTLCADIPCERLNVRVWVIENMIQQGDRSPRYLAIGDSIMEAADLPDICGRKPINAGIAGATVGTFEFWGWGFANLAQPDFIIVALGTNDALKHNAEGFHARLSALISSLNRWPVIVVPLPPVQKVKDAARLNAAIETLPVTKAAVLDRIDTTDGVHLTLASYAAWKNSIVSAASKAICS